MYDFEYHRPGSVRKAASLLKSSPEAKLLAGGQTLLPTMKQRLAAPEAIIDLSGIAALSGIKATTRTVVIGAMTTHAQIVESADVNERLPALAALAGEIGDPPVRHRGTLGGSIANNDPAADYPAACVALEATIETNTRKIPAEEFFTGMFETALEEDEIVTKVAFPVARRAGYAKFANPASRYAMVGVFVARRGKSVRVAVTGAGPSVFRWTEAEEALSGRFNAKSLDGLAASADGLNDDIHGSAEYRAHLIGVMARRAVAAA